MLIIETFHISHTTICSATGIHQWLVHDCGIFNAFTKQNELFSMNLMTKLFVYNYSTKLQQTTACMSIHKQILTMQELVVKSHSHVNYESAFQFVNRTVHFSLTILKSRGVIQKPYSNIKTIFPGIGIPIIKKSYTAKMAFLYRNVLQVTDRHPAVQLTIIQGSQLRPATSKTGTLTCPMSFCCRSLSCRSSSMCCRKSFSFISALRITRWSSCSNSLRRNGKVRG